MFGVEVLNELKFLLTQGKSAAIVSHRGPDGDSLGSSLGLKLFLEKQFGVSATVIVPDAFPGDMSWLPGAGKIKIFENSVEECSTFLKNTEVIFCLDFNQAARVFDMEQPLRDSPATKIMLDHHQQPEAFVKWTWSDVTASSTCEIVYQLIAAWGMEAAVDRDIATCLYTGIMTDTGSFRYSVTSASTHRVVAALLDTGIEQWKIHETIFNQNSQRKLRLWGYALAEKLVVVDQYRTAYISLDMDELERFGYEDGDLEGLVNYALSIRSMVVGILITRRKNKIRISFRSVGDFSVNKFARSHFSGGGHENAAGGTFEGTLAETLEHITSVLPLYKDQLAPNA